MSTRNAKYAYTTVNSLSHHVTIRRAEKVAESGAQIFIRDIEEELAVYCEVTRDTIQMIKRGVNQPSLAVALKIAEYFGVPVEEIFKLKEDK